MMKNLHPLLISCLEFFELDPSERGWRLTAWRGLKVRLGKTESGSLTPTRSIGVTIDQFEVYTGLSAMGVYPINLDALRTKKWIPSE